MRWILLLSLVAWQSLPSDVEHVRVHVEEESLTMARSFDGTNDSLQATVDLSAYNAIALSFRLYWDAFANDDDLAMEFSANYNSNAGGFIVDPNSGDGSFGVGLSGNAGVSSVRFARPSGAAWHAYVINMDMGLVTNELASVYVDGANQTITSRPSNFNNTANFGSYSLYAMSRAAASLFGAGRMADLAIYGGVNLSAGEADALADVAPSLVRPEALVHYWPLMGRTSPEIDVVGGANFTVSGATVADHPRIIYPKRRQTIFVPAAAPGGAQPWLYRSHTHVMRRAVA